MKQKPVKEKVKESSDNLTLNPLDFEEALKDLLQVKPTTNKKLVKQKKKRKPSKPKAKK